MLGVWKGKREDERKIRGNAARGIGKVEGMSGLQER